MPVYRRENPKWDEKAIIVTCDCGFPSHQYELSYYEDDIDFPTMYLQVHLGNYQNVIQRIWSAIRYVFGVKSRYGDWDSVSMGKHDVAIIHAFLHNFLEHFE